MVDKRLTRSRRAPRRCILVERLLQLLPAPARGRAAHLGEGTLQRAGLVARRDVRRLHDAAPGGSTHEWVAGAHWDLIITLDDATSEHYSSSSQRKAPHRACVSEVIGGGGCRRACTPTAARTTGRPRRPGPSDAVRACDAPARRGDDSRLLAGSTWAVRAHGGPPAQGARRPRHPTMAEANRYLAEHYRSAFNEECGAGGRSAFVPFIGPGLADILCGWGETA